MTTQGIEGNVTKVNLIKFDEVDVHVDYALSRDGKIQFGQFDFIHPDIIKPGGFQILEGFNLEIVKIILLSPDQEVTPVDVWANLNMISLRPILLTETFFLAQKFEPPEGVLTKVLSLGTVSSGQATCFKSELTGSARRKKTLELFPFQSTLDPSFLIAAVEFKKQPFVQSAHSKEQISLSDN